MKKTVIPLLSVVLIVGAVWIGGTVLIKKKAESLCESIGVGDTVAVVGALSAYYRDVAQFPVGTTVLDMKAALEPRYITLVPSQGIRYYSDGLHYELSVRRVQDGAQCPCEFTIRDGVLVAWPDWLKREQLEKRIPMAS